MNIQKLKSSLKQFLAKAETFLRKVETSGVLQGEEGWAVTGEQEQIREKLRSPQPGPAGIVQKREQQRGWETPESAHSLPVSGGSSGRGDGRGFWGAWSPTGRERTWLVVPGCRSSSALSAVSQSLRASELSKVLW